jgi:heme oxygenase
MEEEMEKLQHHPIVSHIYFPILNRKQALEQDLAFYYGVNWRNEIAPSVAAQEYVNRIHEVAATEPELLAAHSYTRYLGDLSGGQILMKIAQRAMNLGENGTSFYRFKDIPDEKEFKNKYRAALNDLPVDEATAQRIVEEANAAFGMNMKMFNELEGNLVKAIGIMVFNTLTRRRSQGSTELATAE